MKVENPDIEEDILLIRQILLGDKTAFEKLVLKYRPAIYALARSYAQNAADAEDLTQEVFIKAYQNLRCLKNLEQFPFWLRQIARLSRYRQSTEAGEAESASTGAEASGRLLRIAWTGSSGENFVRRYRSCEIVIEN
ncbi:TPA: hypothetical protein EYP66_14340 [Candidatus Poribacteria bacterium]|nr:hypothetical protein [Candidatus Poribacteria bacterium]